MENSVIKNKILLGILHSFCDDFSLRDSEEKAFEKLVSYVVCSKTDPESFSNSNVLDEIDVDRNGTFGIDTIALFVNGRLVTSTEDIKEHAAFKRLDVKLIFIQSKRSSSVDSGDFLKFTSAVKAFFAEDEIVMRFEEVMQANTLYKELFKPENVKYIVNNKIKCEIYYATTGGNTSDDNIQSLVRREENELGRNVNEVSDFTIRHIGADYIIDSHSEIENTYNVVIDFKNKISCGTINGVEQSFIGYLPVSEFIKLIKGSDGNIRKNIFYENVRDYQGGDNSVNKEIASTLKSDEDRDKFLLLNNGITIVSKSFVNLKSDDYQISDYYIVNGCQTSNVIYSLAENISERKELNIPVKIIHTLDNNIINSLIRSTNKQTPVPDEAFLSLDKFHKRLQDYYKAVSRESGDKIYYERRSKEYSNSSENIERSRIVNLHGQIKSFVSIILGEPQLAMSNNPNSILKEHRGKIFLEEHPHAAYYLSSLLLYKFHKLNLERKIQQEYVISRYWICWLVLILENGDILGSQINSKKTIDKLDSIIEKINDDVYAEKIFKKAINLHNKIKKDFKEMSPLRFNKDIVRSRAFKEYIKNNIVNKYIM